MKILIEIPDKIIEKDGLDSEDVLNIIEGGISYMARVGGSHNLTSCNISSTIMKTKK